jgi:hypothetical protein
MVYFCHLRPQPPRLLYDLLFEHKSVSLLWCDLGIARFSLTLFSVLSGTPLMLHICLGTSEAFSSILRGTFVMHDVFSGPPFLLCFVKLLKGSGSHDHAFYVVLYSSSPVPSPAWV